MQVQGTISELSLIGGLPSAHIVCEAAVIPTPGQYLLAHEQGSDAPLATELFAAGYHLDGFIAAPPIRRDWRPGSVLNLRGPLGSGFHLPGDARRVALIACNDDPSRLLPLAEVAVRRDAAVALVCGNPPSDLPLHLEIHPPRALVDVCTWADYAAFDVEARSVTQMVRAVSQGGGGLRAGASAQALVRASMPCGGLAACGVCTVRTARGPRLACLDGPVFDLRLLIPER